jgi:hypothetical protein
VIDGQVSNSVVIEVTAYSQPTIYYPPIYNQPSYYVPAYSYYQQLFKLCPDGRQLCNGQCCPQGQNCIDGRCQTPLCYDGRARCSGQCCPADKTCINGVCRPVTEAEARAAESRRQQAAANGTYDPTKGITPYLLA